MVVVWCGGGGVVVVVWWWWWCGCGSVGDGVVGDQCDGSVVAVVWWVGWVVVGVVMTFNPCSVLFVRPWRGGCWCWMG